jgi:phosphoribosylformylglycinamidine synthase
VRARVHIRPKPGVLDPQGAAIGHALSQLGFRDVSEVRQGKLIELDLDHHDREVAEAEVRAMCDRLLANPVIETYSVSFDD